MDQFFYEKAKSTLLGLPRDVLVALAVALITALFNRVFRWLIYYLLRVLVVFVLVLLPLRLLTDYQSVYMWGSGLLSAVRP